MANTVATGVPAGAPATASRGITPDGAELASVVSARAAKLAERYEPARAYQELLSLAERRLLGGLPPWADLPKQSRAFAKAAGLNRATSALLLAGMPGVWQKVLGVHGLTPMEEAAGQEELRRLTRAERLDLFEAAMPQDPPSLWDQKAFALRLAEAWVARHGRQVTLPEATIAAAMALPLKTEPVTELLSLAAVPAAADLLTRDVETWPDDVGYRCVRRADGEGGLDDSYLHDLAMVIPWAYAALPEGDPVRAGIPELLRLLLDRLNFDGLLLNGFAAPWIKAEELAAAPGFEPYLGRHELDVPLLDDGLTIAEGPPHGKGGLFFRPARLGDDPRSDLLRSVFAERASLEAVTRLRGDGYAAMAARIGALPEGAYEANPLLSAPELVAEVASAKGLDEDAAALYLQLLTLLEPTTGNVRTWNGWTHARHRGAVAALLAAGLVVPDKREKAGRGVFLPGPWIGVRQINRGMPWNKSSLPLEEWKTPMYEPVTRFFPKYLPSRPLPELFAWAWARVEKGEGPR